MERKTEDKNKQTHLKKNVSTKVNDAMKQTGGKYPRTFCTLPMIA